MKNKLFLCLTTTLIYAYNIIAQDKATHRLSFKGCVEYGLKNHTSVAVQNNNIKIATLQATDIKAGYLPQVNGNFTADKNIELPTSVIPEGVFGPDELIVKFGTKFATFAILQADQMIFDKPLIIDIKTSKPKKEIASLNREKNDEDIIFNTSNAYASVLILKEQEKLLGEKEKKYNELLPALKEQYQKGEINKIVYDRMRVAMLNILSQKQVAHTNYQLALNLLKNAIGMPLTHILTVTDSVNINSELPPLTEQQDFKVASVIDHKIHKQHILLNRFDTRRKQAAYLPTVLMFTRYGVSYLGQTVDKTFSRSFDFSVVGIRINVPVFSSFRRNSQLQQSRLLLENAEKNLELNEANWILDNQNSRTKLISSYTNALTNKENMVLAQDVFTTTSQEYLEGKVSLTDLLNADFSNKEAQTNYINSIVNYYNASFEFERSKGTLIAFLKSLP